MTRFSVWPPFSPHGRYSLLELMTTMAVGATLTAIAIPHFVHAQAKARFAEVAPNTRSITDAVMAYELSMDQLPPNANWNPNLPVVNPPASLPVPWDHADGTWAELGWEPDGDVYATYVYTQQLPTANFAVGAACDVDRDGVWRNLIGTYAPDRTLLYDIDDCTAVPPNPTDPWSVPGPCW